MEDPILYRRVSSSYVILGEDLVSSQLHSTPKTITLNKINSCLLNL